MARTIKSSGRTLIKLGAGQSGCDDRRLQNRVFFILGASGGRTSLSAMAGWAHYFARGNSASAGFVSLPGTTFTMQGAAGASDTALVSLGVSHDFPSGLGLFPDADGEFGQGTIGYAAKGKVSWRW